MITFGRAPALQFPPGAAIILRMRKGRLIVFEGIDGAGKSTQARMLRRKLRARGRLVSSFREPSRSRWGRMLRAAAKTAGSLTPAEELDLFVKDRQENVARNILPALRAGRTVILDRYYFSTVAYQGAKGIDPKRIRRMNERFAPKPDLVILLDVDAAGGLDRIKGRKSRDLLFEREDYLRRVRRIFQSFRGPRFFPLDGRRGKRELGREILARALAVLER